MRTLLIALLLAAATAAHASEPRLPDAVDAKAKRVFIHDAVLEVKDSPGFARVTFRHHAAVYRIDLSAKQAGALVEAARRSAADKSLVHATVRADGRVIERIAADPDPARPKGTP